MQNENIEEKVFLKSSANYELLFRPIICKHCSYRILSLYEIGHISNKFNSRYQANSLLGVFQIPFQGKDEVIGSIVYPFFNSDSVYVSLSDSLFCRVVELENIGMMDFSFSFALKSAIAIYSGISYKMAIIDWYENEDCAQIAEISLFSDEIYNKRMQLFYRKSFDNNRFDVSNFAEPNIFVVKEESIRSIMHIICGLANKIDVFSSFLIILVNKNGLSESLDDEMAHFNSYITYCHDIYKDDKNEYLVVQILPVMFGLTLYRGRAWTINDIKKAIPASFEESNNIYMTKLGAF